MFHFVDAYETSKMLCEQYYLTSPDMEITEVNCKSCKTTPFSNSYFVFVPCQVSLPRASIGIGHSSTENMTT